MVMVTTEKISGFTFESKVIIYDLKTGKFILEVLKDLNPEGPYGVEELIIKFVIDFETIDNKIIITSIKFETFDDLPLKETVLLAIDFIDRTTEYLINKIIKSDLRLIIDKKSLDENISKSITVKQN